MRTLLERLKPEYRDTLESIACEYKSTYSYTKEVLGSNKLVGDLTLNQAYILLRHLLGIDSSITEIFSLFENE